MFHRGPQPILNLLPCIKPKSTSKFCLFSKSELLREGIFLFKRLAIAGMVFFTPLDCTGTDFPNVVSGFGAEVNIPSNDGAGKITKCFNLLILILHNNNNVS